MSILLLTGWIDDPGAFAATETNAPSLWSAGIEWDAAETPGSNAYWQASEVATARSGRPVPCIAIGGRRIDEQLSGGDWTLGRTDWMSSLSPNTANFSFVGVVQAALNEPIVVSVESDVTTEHSDALWIGRVDSVSVTQDVSGAYWTTISATDIIGVLGEARAPGSVAAGDLQSLTESMALDAGVTLEVITDDTLQALSADSDVDSSVLEYINRMERSSNALLFLLGNGKLKAVVRQARVGSVATIPLTGSDSFANWTEQTSLGNVINDWDWTNEAASWHSFLGADTHDAYAESQVAYGKRSFSVSDMLTNDATVYAELAAGTGNALSVPRPIVTSADFPIHDLSQQVLFLDPLDWVTHDVDTWQVMSVQHSVSPGDWRVTITADQTQNFLLGLPDPEPVDPPSPSGTTTITQTYISTKSATVSQDSGGNGAGDYLAVGKYGGDLTRALVQFPIPSDWEDDFPDFIEVVSASVEFRTTGQVWVAFGSDPKFYIRRLTESWTEGTFTGPPGSQYGTSNSVKWSNQPSATSTGQKVRGISDSENNDFEVAITEIAQGWHDHGNYGLRLQSYNEDASSRTTEFYSDDHATSGFRPVLTLKCRVAV